MLKLCDFVHELLVQATQVDFIVLELLNLTLHVIEGEPVLLLRIIFLRAKVSTFGTDRVVSRQIHAFLYIIEQCSLLFFKHFELVAQLVIIVQIFGRGRFLALAQFEFSDLLLQILVLFHSFFGALLRVDKILLFQG